MQSNTRPNWDDYFLGIAEAVSQRADCTRRKVGFILVDEDHRIIGTGYNGAHPGGPSCLKGECPRGRKSFAERPPLTGGYDDCISTHAEPNGLLFARTSCKGATGYITDPPCKDCRKLLVSAGLKRVVWKDENGTVVSEDFLP